MYIIIIDARDTHKSNVLQMMGVALRQFSRDIYKYVAIDILCYIILFYCIILLFQILN